MTDELKKIDKAALSALPAETFNGRIVVVQTPEVEAKALRYLLDQKVIGFDTETRPNFRRSDDHRVSLIQLSSEDTCFLFRINRLGISELMKQLLHTEKVLKIGLSTKDDFHQLNRVAAVTTGGFVELQDLAHEHGIGEMSLTKIYAILFGKRISKAQRLTNWEANELTPAQQHYAALDAWACLHIYSELIGRQR